MLGAGDDAVGRAIVRALKPTDSRARQSRAEVRVFAGAFDDAAPTRVARDVEHRGESPVDSGGPRLGGGDGGGALDARGVPTARLGERDGEDGAVAVNHVEAEDERDFETRAFDGDALQLVRVPHAAHVQGRAEQTFADEFRVLILEAPVGVAVELLELSEFLFERHPREQRLDSPLHVAPRRALRVREGGRESEEHEGEGETRPLGLVHV